MPPRYKVVDLFCGAGGFSDGFEKSGRFEIKLGIDTNKDCVESFKMNNPDAMVICSDIRSVKDETLKELSERNGPFDVVIGGPPCQGFSSIRPFRSINDNDSRNNLYEEFGRFVNILRPKVFVLENVVGLLTHHCGKSFEQILSGFSELGYNTTYKVLNAVHYGVPQRRERIFAIGATKGRISLPKPSHFYANNKSMAKEKDRLIVWGTGQKLLLEDKSVMRLSSAITVMDAIEDLPPLKSGEEATTYRNDYPSNNYQKARRKNLSRLTLHKATDHTPRMLEIIRNAGSNRYVLPKGMTKSGFSTSYSRLEPHEPSVTLTVNFVHPASNKCIHPFQDRALTPREGARLQSFDDDYVFCGNRASIVDQIGNAVPPLLAKAVAEEVANFLITFDQ